MPSATAQERQQQQQRDENSARWATVVSDWSQTKISFDAPYPPRFHPSEHAARTYAADIFRRRKCNVLVLTPQSKGGAIVEDLRYDAAAEIALRELRWAEAHEGPPAVVMRLADAEDPAA